MTVERAELQNYLMQNYKMATGPNCPIGDLLLDSFVIFCSWSLRLVLSSTGPNFNSIKKKLSIRRDDIIFPLPLDFSKRGGCSETGGQVYFII